MHWRGESTFADKISQIRQPDQEMYICICMYIYIYYILSRKQIEWISSNRFQGLDRALLTL